MKKNKIIQLKSERHQSDMEDDCTIQTIQQAFEKVDETHSVYTPNLQWFEEMVRENQQKQRSKLAKEFAIFLLIAVVIVTGVVLTLLQTPLIFIVLQGLVLLALPIIIYWQQRKQVVDV
ncbi:YxlC family protein [Bacillus timonensis]|nr:YxlC family protein [Bacillus timonensis]